MMPSSGIRPWVGLIVLVPQHAEGIRSDPQVSVPSAAGDIRAARAAALPPLEPPHDAIKRPRVSDLVGGAAGGELVHVGVAEQHHPLVAQPLPCNRVFCRDVALQHATRCRQRQAGDRVEVLQRERDPAQHRRGFAFARHTLVAGAGLLARQLGVDPRPRVDRIRGAPSVGGPPLR